MENKSLITSYKVTEGNKIRIYDEDLNRPLIIRELVNGNIDVDAVYEAGVNLEDYFKELVKEGEND